MYVPTATPQRNPLDSWEIAYLVLREEDGSVRGTAEIQLKRRLLCQTLFAHLRADEGAVILKLRRRCNAWIADWYTRPDAGSADLGMWSPGWGDGKLIA